MTQRRIRNTMFALIISIFVFFCAMTCMAQEAPSRDRRLGPGLHTIRLTVDGLKRTYLVHVPAGYNPRTPSPLVVMLHGGGGTAKGAMWETGWAKKAEEAGFLAVFPNALARDPAQRSSFIKNPQLWNDGSDRFYPGQKAPDDIGFIAAMLDDLFVRFAVDAKRVFITGFSNGASMSFLVGAELSNRIAAIAPVAGACWLKPVTLKQPVSMCYITGTADPLNLIEGGVPRLATGASDNVRSKPKPPVRDSILKWAKALGCSETPTSVLDVDGVRTETYGPCGGGAEVVYLMVEELGHTWAGGKSLLPERIVGKQSKKINATNVIWDFFQKHARVIEDKEAAKPRDAPEAPQAAHPFQCSYSARVH